MSHCVIELIDVPVELALHSYTRRDLWITSTQKDVGPESVT
jgi:hypothetical protein